MGKCKERTCDPNVLVISLVWIEVDFVALQYEWLYQLLEELMMLYDVSEWLVVCSSPVRTITSLAFTRTGVLGLWRCTLMQRSSSEERLQSENPGGGGVRCGMYSVRSSFFWGIFCRASGGLVGGPESFGEVSALISSPLQLRHCLNDVHR